MARRAHPLIHPGEILLKEFLEPMEISQYRLAKDMSVPARRINEIVHGKRAITADTAVRLARFFGNEPGYWMKLQTDYDIALATNDIGIRLYAISPHESATAAGPQPAETERSPLAKIKPGSIRRRLLR